MTKQQGLRPNLGPFGSDAPLVAVSEIISAGLLRTLAALGRPSEADRACTEGIDALRAVGLLEDAARLQGLCDRSLR